MEEAPLTNTITQLIAHSPKGLQIDEIEEILSVNVAPIVTKLFQKGCINREKVGGTLFYFNHINEESAVHYAKANDIVQLIQSNGGYVAHFDGTCEAGTSVLFSGIDEISGIVLLTARMPTENLSEVKKFFTECKNLYDHPLAIMRDLSSNYQPALVYYQRCIYIYDLLQSLLDDSSQVKPIKKKTLSTIVRNLEPFKEDKTIQQVANRLEKQVNLFSQLRDILRFNRPDKKPILRQHPPATATIEEVKETAEKLKQFRQDLHVKTNSKETGHDIKCASKKIIYYLDKYMDELVGHLVTIPGKIR